MGKKQLTHTDTHTHIHNYTHTLPCTHTVMCAHTGTQSHAHADIMHPQARTHTHAHCCCRREGLSFHSSFVAFLLLGLVGHFPEMWISWLWLPCRNLEQNLPRRTKAWREWTLCISSSSCSVARPSRRNGMVGRRVRVRRGERSAALCWESVSRLRVSVSLGLLGREPCPEIGPVALYPWTRVRSSSSFNAYSCFS